jgi:NodT family efflux transporter outer membrane factor (OMF) lipoprotein
MRSRFPIKPIGATLAVLSGCAAGPNFQRPASPIVSGYGSQTIEARELAAGEAQHLIPGADIPAQWWTLFRSADLNALVEEALRANPNLKSAQAGMRIAMEAFYAQRGPFLPSVSAGLSASRNQNSAIAAPFLANNALLYNLYQAQLNASWTLDVFGGTRRAAESARAQVDAARYELEAARVALTTNVVAAAIQEASVRGQIAAARDIVRSELESLEIFRRQYALGQIAGADLAAQEAAAAQAEQTLPPLEKLLAQQQNLLAALVGHLPSEGSQAQFGLANLHLPTDVPVSLPARLVEQRPDVLIAEANYHTACAEVGVAEAAQLPSLTLTANPGAIATEASRLFEAGSEFWGVGAGLTQPLFEGGALYHRTRAAKAALDRAAAQYRSTVLAAFQNVADCLCALQSDAGLLRAAAASERAAASSLDIARRQVDLGALSYLSLLSAEQTYQQARMARVVAEAARYADTAALFQALGGGWWNQSAAAQE